MPNEFDWLDYKAKVAAIMLPHIYQQVMKANSDNQFQPPFNPTCETTNKED